jgi:uncharacterized protein (DUF1501 family)
MRLSRRNLLVGGAAASLMAPRFARAATGASERRFIFVQALGGWDVTQVFAPVFGSSGVEHQAGCEPAALGDLAWVDHVERPNVSRFFSRWADQTALINGVYIASIAHPSALRLSLTSSLDATQADWATRIGAFSASDPVIPHFVVGGSYFAGRYGVHVGRGGTSGQLQALASGELLLQSDVSVRAPSVARAAAVDSWLAAAASRATDRARGAESRRVAEAWERALERSERLKLMADQLDFSGGPTLDEQLDVAIMALEQGVARCVTVAHPSRDSMMNYDSHAVNDQFQSPLFDSLFTSLDTLMDRLATTTSPSGASLAEETVIVVLSEMSRSPTYNGSNGRDHWPCTSVMLLGSGVAGGRMYGAWESGMYGQPVDLASGEPSESGTWLGPEHVGATLLALADVDPGDTGLTVGPIGAVLA